jgi:hypothetical protein
MENSLKTLKSSLNPDIFSFDIVAGLQITYQSTIEKQSQEITVLEKQVAWFKEQFKLANHRQFGKSSETAASVNLSLFDEKMAEDDKGAADESVLPIPARKNQLDVTLIFQTFPKSKRSMI